MRRGNREDVVIRPKAKPRTRAPMKPKTPTLAELAARVAWLEKCQGVNLTVLTRRLDEAEVSIATIKANARVMQGLVEGMGSSVKSMAASAMSAVSLSAESKPMVKSPRPRLTRKGKVALAIILTPIVLIGVSLLLAWFA